MLPQYYPLNNRLGEGAIRRAGDILALLPVVDELAAPVLRLGAVTTIVGGAVRVPAVRALEFNAQGRGVVPELGAEHGLRSVVLLNPADEVVDDVVRSRSGSATLAEHPCTGTRDATDTAVSHTRDTEEAEELIEIGVAGTHGLGHLLVVALAVVARGHRVGHTVVHDHLAASATDTAEVTVERRRVAVEVVFRISTGVVLLVEVEDVERGVVVHATAEPILRNTLDGAGEETKTEGIDLSTVEERRVDKSTLGVVERLEDLLNSVDLGRVEAARGDRIAAHRDGRDVEVTDGGVLKDTVVHTVKLLITLVEDVGLYGGPVGLSKESVIVGGASELAEVSAPVLEVVEVVGRGTGDDTVKVVREFLSGL